MGSVQKVSGGGTVIVRTGTLAGVGPVGPKGSKGDRGAQGPNGSEGPTGPAGYVTEALSVGKIGTTQPIGPGNQIQVAWAAIERDDLGVFTSSTVITPDEIGAIYSMVGFLIFEAPANVGDGIRDVWVMEDGDNDETLFRSRFPASPTGQTCIPINVTFEAKPGCTYKVFAAHSDDLSVAVATGRVAITRVGPGQPGSPGPVGPAGPVGPVGPLGPKGNDGDANSGFDSFDELG